MSTIEDWRPLIVEMVRAKDDLAAWDPRGIFPNHLPAVAATDDEIRSIEELLGVALDSEQRGSRPTCSPCRSSTV
ncbi:hypothetical protein [Microbacterium sp.]|uniref:hypothetical protein n=1 Tax=Microbacterium sp. TaxID=51671 RepID=UPI003F711CB3